MLHTIPRQLCVSYMKTGSQRCLELLSYSMLYLLKYGSFKYNKLPLISPSVTAEKWPSVMQRSLCTVSRERR